MRYGGDGRAPKHVGGRYLLLVVLGAAGALAFAWNAESEQAKTAATLLAGAGPLYLAWKAFRHDRAEAATADLDRAADRLAVAVRRQWEEEAAIRRLNDPYPLPVAWRAADADLVEPWPLLADMARAWPGGPPGDPGEWAADHARLAGADGEIGGVFTQRVPTRRLVVLGEPGSGKTMLLVRLLQDLIERRTEGGAVPVLFSLASWNPAGESLNDWLTGQLRQSYPGLGAAAPGHQGDLAGALLDSGRILPLLDGFDELPPALHDLGLTALNRDLPAKRPLVLAGREAAYREAVARPDATTRLNGAAGIRLLPLAPQDAESYLRRDAGGPHAPAASRWDAVAAQLGTDTPVGQALSTPLGLFLARTIYNPRPDIPAPPSTASDPAELCDTTAFPTRTALDAHLFHAFIHAAYAPHGPNPPRWNAAQAHRTHAFLARHLEDNRAGSPNLAWWQLTSAIRPGTFRLTFALATSLAAFLIVFLAVGLTIGMLNGFMYTLETALAYGPTEGLTFGAMAGLTVGLTGGFMVGSPRRDTSTPEPDWSFRSLVKGTGAAVAVFLAIWVTFMVSEAILRGLRDGFASGLMFGLAFGLTSGMAIWSARPHTPSSRIDWSSRSLAYGFTAFLIAFVGIVLVVGVTVPLASAAVVLKFGLAGGLGFGLKAVLRAEKPDPATMAGPVKLLSRDRRTFLVTFLVVGLLYGLTGGLAAGFTSDDDYGLSYAITNGIALGLVFGLMGGLIYGLTEAVAWAGFAVAIAHLAMRRRQVPWKLMAFLRDAHENRGVLRQVGAVYQFRHLDLQRHLAGTSAPPAARQVAGRSRS